VSTLRIRRLHGRDLTVERDFKPRIARVVVAHWPRERERELGGTNRLRLTAISLPAVSGTGDDIARHPWRRAAFVTGRAVL
jgi:hypothetical protein